MKIVSYNVLCGFSEKKHLDGVSRWLQEVQPEIVAFQELNGFSHGDLADAALAWNHPHSILLKEDGFSTGLTSFQPITDVQRIREGYHHGLLVGCTHELRLFVVHLSPHKYIRRQEEAKLICDRVGEVIAVGEDVVVLGDFNSVSPLDQAYYDQNPAWLAKARFNDNRKEICENLCDGQLDYSVHQKFLKVPLVDTVAQLSPSDGNELLHYTFPTSEIYSSDRPEFADARGRIDYIYVSPELSRRLVLAQAINGDRLTAYSDHFPVLAEFRD